MTTNHTPTHKFEWVTARTLRHLHVNGNGTNIDAPIPKSGDLPHVAEIQEYVVKACNAHDDLVAALEIVKAVSSGDKAKLESYGFDFKSGQQCSEWVIEKINIGLAKARGE